jgi:hypothetical protein
VRHPRDAEVTVGGHRRRTGGVTFQGGQLGHGEIAQLRVALDAAADREPPR